MAEVTKPLALDETLQQVVSKLGNISSVAGASAYTQAVAGGYTGTQAEFEAQIAKQPIVVNPNLLDNWYFVGGGSQQGGGQFPINQKGQTYYSSGAYSIDVWRLIVAGISVVSGGIELSNASGSAYGPTLRQPIVNPAKLVGKKVTVSALVGSTSSGFTVGLAKATGINSGFVNLGAKSLSTPGLVSFTVTIPDDVGGSSYPMLIISLSCGAGTSTTFVAAKLELGDTQTLAHNEGTDANPVWVLNEIPNFTEELWKCQRYYQLFASSTYRPTYGEDYRPPMRLHSPTKGTISIGGTTYYYADANL